MHKARWLLLAALAANALSAQEQWVSCEGSSGPGKGRRIADYTHSGKPIAALRGSTHAFNHCTRPDSSYARYSYNSKDPQGGWGRLVPGETWINHHGAHQKESTRGVIAPGMEKHPVLRGAGDIRGPSDVYGITTLPPDAQPLVLGQVLIGMNPIDPPNPAKKLVPVARVPTFTGEKNTPARVCTTTMGHAGDLQNEGFGRLLVNACDWALKLERKLPARSKADIAGAYAPNPIHAKKQKTGLKPEDLKEVRDE
jgi:hypothetical protein